MSSSYSCYKMNDAILITVHSPNIFSIFGKIIIINKFIYLFPYSCVDKKKYVICFTLVIADDVFSFIFD